MLLSTGEQVSIALLAMALSSKGLSAISLTGWQAGICSISSYYFLFGYKRKSGGAWIEGFLSNFIFGMIRGTTRESHTIPLVVISIR